ncbi:hypothetical protein [Rhodococcus sp. ACS1]|nr:hypothetical protein [Rhodococcus sp. ACS1]
MPWDKYPEDADLVVVADTEGNLFCVIDNAGIAKDLRLELSEGGRGENAD